MDEDGRPKRDRYLVSEEVITRPPDYKAGKELLERVMGPVLSDTFAIGTFGEEGEDPGVGPIDPSRLPLELRMQLDVAYKEIAIEDEQVARVETEEGTGDGKRTGMVATTRRGTSGGKKRVIMMDESDWDKA